MLIGVMWHSKAVHAVARSMRAREDQAVKHYFSAAGAVMLLWLAFNEVSKGATEGSEEISQGLALIISFCAGALAVWGYPRRGTS